MAFFDDIRHELQALDPDRGDLRRFSWLVGGILTLIGAWLAYRGASEDLVSWILIGVGGALLVTGTVAPPLVRRAYFAWMGLAAVLGWGVTRVLLTLFFFGVLTPVGLFFRLRGRDELKRRIDRAAPTYWEEKKLLIVDRSRFEKFF